MPNLQLWISIRTTENKTLLNAAGTSLPEHILNDHGRRSYNSECIKH